MRYAGFFCFLNTSVWFITFGIYRIVSSCFELSSHLYMYIYIYGTFYAILMLVNLYI